jgi:hypothetical protein
LQRSNDNAACGHDSKFKPLVLGEIQAADDNQAEAYLNERLTACGESWRLDANTRKMLGLPPRAN